MLPEISSDQKTCIAFPKPEPELFGLQTQCLGLRFLLLVQLRVVLVYLVWFSRCRETNEEFGIC